MNTCDIVPYVMLAYIILHLYILPLMYRLDDNTIFNTLSL